MPVRGLAVDLSMIMPYDGGSIALSVEFRAEGRAESCVCLYR